MKRWLLCATLGCEAARGEPSRVEPAFVEPAFVEPASIEPASIEPPRVEPPPVEPAVAVAPVATPWRGSVPADPASIRAFLQTFAYRGWAPQTAIRATGEHGGERLYFNDTLVASLKAGAQEHPPGSAAVRELYDGDLSTLKGFALMHKYGPSGTLGEGWYWYEIFGTTAEHEPTVAEFGARGCVGCHSHAVDFVHSPDTPREDPQPLL